jgi:2-polyprenyl-6-methoxyphenol hydroxylase-like FAD-dependent oxidoreductase
MTQQTCSQTWFDPILRQFARSYSHVTLRHRCRLEIFQATNDGVTAEIRNLETGEVEKIQARFLAACDGANSRIRRALGIKLIGSEVLSRPVHMFFRSPDLFRKLGLRPGTFFLTIDSGGLWANVRIIDPMEGLWRLMVLDTPPDLDPNSIDCEAYLRRALGRHIDVEWVGVSVWTRRGVVADRYSQGPVHLLGDAVHQLSPTGALGMNTGIADAVDLGWKLAAVLEGWGGDSLLASYDSERRPIGERNVRLATGYFENHRDFERGVKAIEDATPEGEQIRQRIGEQLIRDLARMFRTIGVQLGYRYDLSPICVPDGTPSPADEPEVYVPSARPGGRAPHVWLADGRSTLDLFGHGFVLLRIGGGAPRVSEFVQAATRVKLPLDVVTLNEPVMLERYGCPLVLVRPDGHVAWRGDDLPTDVEVLIDRVRGTGWQVN